MKLKISSIILFISIFLLLSINATWSWGSNLALEDVYGEGKGIGGTGLKIEGKGIGGTGLKIDGKGIGGTGLKIDGDIGVYGVITGFGSIFVNDIEVFFDEKTPVDNDGQNIIAQDLKIGQVVALVGYKKNNKILARNISVRPIISGKVESIDVENNSFQVSGKTIHVESTEALSKTLNIGENISVGGFTNDKGDIVASSIEREEERAKRVRKKRNIFKGIRNFSIQGRVREAGGSSKIYINNDIIMPIAARGLPFRHNKRVILFGTLNKQGRLNVRSFKSINRKLKRRTFFYKRKKYKFNSLELRKNIYKKNKKLKKRFLKKDLNKIYKKNNKINHYNRKNPTFYSNGVRGIDKNNKKHRSYYNYGSNNNYIKRKIINRDDYKSLGNYKKNNKRKKYNRKHIRNNNNKQRRRKNRQH